jgi:protein ImuB
LRRVRIQAYRVDQQVETQEVQVQKPTAQAAYLFALFALKIPQLRPGPGIEVFVLDAWMVETMVPDQEQIWDGEELNSGVRLDLLIDRISNQIGASQVYRYQGGQTYWPEHRMERVGIDQNITNKHSRNSTSLSFSELDDRSRPAHLLDQPEPIQVAAPVPDYPPLLFRHKEVVHTIRKADGPERLEQPWWIQDGQHRDYFYVEDEEGRRYWIFRLGDYRTGTWFLHGYCV